MARGRKKLTLDEQLAKNTADIAAAEAQLEELKKTKNELEEKIKANRLAELDKFINSHGLSIEEVKELIEKK